MKQYRRIYLLALAVVFLGYVRCIYVDPYVQQARLKNESFADEYLRSRSDLFISRRLRSLLNLDEDVSMCVQLTDKNVKYLWTNGWLRLIPDEMTATVLGIGTKIKVVTATSSEIEGYSLGKPMKPMNSGTPTSSPVPPSPAAVPTFAPSFKPPTVAPSVSISPTRSFAPSLPPDLAPDDLITPPVNNANLAYMLGKYSHIWTKYLSEHRHRKVVNPNQELPKRKFKVYYAIFAGRREFMHIHLKYTDILLKDGLVDEVHLWDFVSPERCADSTYLENFIRNTDISGYILFKRPIYDYDKFSPLKGGYLWGSFYSHYRENKRYNDHDF